MPSCSSSSRKAIESNDSADESQVENSPATKKRKPPAGNKSKSRQHHDQLDQIDPNVIEEYLRQQRQQQSRRDRGAASGDLPKDNASSNNINTPTALRMVSKLAAPCPMPRPLTQDTSLASSPPQFTTRFTSVGQSSPPTEALSTAQGSSPPQSSIRFSSPEASEVVNSAGPPFKPLYQPGNKPAVSDYALDAQPVMQMVIDEYEVRSHGSRIHGQVIKNARAVVQSHYMFSTVGNGAAIAKNRRLCEMLVTKSAFHYKNPSEHKGYCQNPIVSNILHETWHHQGNADGVIFDQYFNPLPLECLALIFTALSFSIEEWSTGSRKQASFTETIAEAKYRAHLNDLELWNGLNPAVTEKICKKLCQRAQRYAGVINDDPVAPQLVGDLIDSARKELEGRSGETDTEELCGTTTLLHRSIKWGLGDQDTRCFFLMKEVEGNKEVECKTYSLVCNPARVHVISPSCTMTDVMIWKFSHMAAVGVIRSLYLWRLWGVVLANRVVSALRFLTVESEGVGIMKKDPLKPELQNARGLKTTSTHLSPLEHSGLLHPMPPLDLKDTHMALF
ncbi:hypothetical protein BDQ17DRAFT_1335078 [Cyathus striatus]|nr:hypothetical protein BDQ17DRAFT_1335078 [Cyathus striatus]